MFAFAYLILATATEDMPATQTRLDQLIHGCQAEKVVRLTARNSRDVIADLLDANLADPNERAKGECVLNGMRAMTDLQFEIIGNASPTAP